MYSEKRCGHEIKNPIVLSIDEAFLPLELLFPKALNELPR